jgi:hypothetical protein
MQAIAVGPLIFIALIFLKQGVSALIGTGSTNTTQSGLILFPTKIFPDF